MKIGDKVQCIKLEHTDFYLKKYFIVLKINNVGGIKKEIMLTLKPINIENKIIDKKIHLYQYKLRKLSNFEYTTLKLKGIVT